MDESSTNIVEVFDIQLVSKDRRPVVERTIINDAIAKYGDKVRPVSIEVSDTCTQTLFEYLCSIPETDQSDLDKLKTIYDNASEELKEILDMGAFHATDILSVDELELLFTGLRDISKTDYTPVWLELLKKLR